METPWRFDDWRELQDAPLRKVCSISLCHDQRYPGLEQIFLGSLMHPMGRFQRRTGINSPGCRRPFSRQALNLMAQIVAFEPRQSAQLLDQTLATDKDLT